MRIGIDFDNTIVNYDGVFYRTGLELGWLPKEMGHSKQAVKSYFIDKNSESKWTELQGIVYGKTIANAVPYDGFIDVISKWRKKGYEIFLVSHKTKHPIIGDKLDFHQAALNWLDSYDLKKQFDEIYFCEQKDGKVAKIAELNLDCFIDDLQDVLLHKSFPECTQRYLFGVSSSEIPNIRAIPHWKALAAL